MNKRRVLVLLLLLVSGCGLTRPSNLPSPFVLASPAIPHLEDVTAKAGINWTHNPCRTGHKYLPETVGGGGGFLDYNHDGLLDILLINGAPLPGYKGPIPHNALYRNNGDGTFTDVTKEVGLDLHEYGMGAAVGDYDNDGWPDIFLTAVGHTHLMHNEHGHFVDVTRKLGTDISGFTTAAAWLDYDRDGRLDLYVGRYVEWTPQTDLPCGPANARQYCAPHQYRAAQPVLLHQKSDGTFEDVSREAGILGHSGKTLAVEPYDFNGDGWVDLYVANDTEPDLLLINNHDGTFTDQGLESGVALGTDAAPTGSMGIDIGTPFNDGRTAIAVGVFAGQQMSLFVSQGSSKSPLLFDNAKLESRLGPATGAMTTFGLVMADINGDGWPDILCVNGHIDDDPSLIANGSRVTYRQLPQLFLNQGNGTFQDVGQKAGLTTPLIGRGLAVGDYDNDGRPDFLTFENGGKVRLWHNTTERKGNWLGIELLGRAPRDATGAMVTLTGKGWSQTRCVTTARSYLSVNDPRLLFGIPTSGAIQVSIRWPGGKETTRNIASLNRYVRISEDE
jgi:hypothetical protein